MKTFELEIMRDGERIAHRIVRAADHDDAEVEMHRLWTDSGFRILDNPPGVSTDLRELEA